MRKQLILCLMLGFIACDGFLTANKAPCSENGPAPVASPVNKKEETISCEELRQWQTRHDTFLLFDARDKKSYEMMHIEEAQLPLLPAYYEKMDLFNMQVIKDKPDFQKAKESGFARFSKELPVVTYCNTGCAAGRHLADDLRKTGFKNVRVMSEGIQAWQNKGYPVILGKNVRVVDAKDITVKPPVPRVAPNPVAPKKK